jgi:ATP-dependent Clp protease adaptor protein ClpS
MSNADAEVTNKIEVNQSIKEPPLYKVIYINDNKTSMEFVIDSLVEYFDYNPVTAHEITLNIHNEGAATVAVLPYEVAEQKGIEVSLSARAQDYPLQIKLEPEDA